MLKYVPPTDRSEKNADLDLRSAIERLDKKHIEFLKKLCDHRDIVHENRMYLWQLGSIPEMTIAKRNHVQPLIKAEILHGAPSYGYCPGMYSFKDIRKILQEIDSSYIPRVHEPTEKQKIDNRIRLAIAQGEMISFDQFRSAITRIAKEFNITEHRVLNTHMTTMAMPGWVFAHIQNYKS